MGGTNMNYSASAAAYQQMLNYAALSQTARNPYSAQPAPFPGIAMSF